MLDQTEAISGHKIQGHKIQAGNDKANAPPFSHCYINGESATFPGSAVNTDVLVGAQLMAATAGS